MSSLEFFQDQANGVSLFNQNFQDVLQLDLFKMNIGLEQHVREICLDFKVIFPMLCGDFGFMHRTVRRLINCYFFNHKFCSVDYSFDELAFAISNLPDPAVPQVDTESVFGMTVWTHSKLFG
jgi:hypothetical protein